MLCQGEELFLAYLASFIHESCHYLAAKACKADALGLRADIFGFGLKLPCILKSADRIIICASGPLANFLMFLALSVTDRIFPFMGRGCAFFAFANFCIGLINLLPISPLDGGGIVKALFARAFGIILGGRIFRALSLAFCLLFASFCFLFARIGIFNPALLIFSVFLILGIRKERFLALNETKRVLSGESLGGRNLKYIAYDGDVPILNAVSRINADCTLHTAVFSEGRFIGELSQEELVFAIKKHGAYAELKDCIEK